MGGGTIWNSIRTGNVISNGIILNVVRCYVSS